MFDITQLTEFNPALVYGFDPEPPPGYDPNKQTFKNSLFPQAHQHQDMLNAYMYAQNTILAFIMEHGRDAITEPMLLEWINTLHRLIGKSLLEMLNTESENYTERYLFRWHHGRKA